MENAKVIQLGVHNLDNIDQGSFMGQALKKLNLTKFHPNLWNSRTVRVSRQKARIKKKNKQRLTKVDVPSRRKSPRNIKRITVFADDSSATGTDGVGTPASTSAGIESLASEETLEIKFEEADESLKGESDRFSGSSETKSTGVPDSQVETGTTITRAQTRKPFTSTKLIEVKSTHSSYPERKPKKRVTKGPRTSNLGPKKAFGTKVVRDGELEKKSPRRASDGRPLKQPGRRALKEFTPSQERLHTFISHFKATGRATMKPNLPLKKIKFFEEEKPKTLTEVEVELMLYETDKASEQIEFQVDLWNQIEKSNLLSDMNEEIKQIVKNGSILLKVKLAKARELILNHKESLEFADRKKEDISSLLMHHEMTQREFKSVVKMFETLENSLSKSESSVLTFSKASLVT